MFTHELSLAKTSLAMISIYLPVLSLIEHFRIREGNINFLSFENDLFCTYLGCICGTLWTSVWLNSVYKLHHYLSPR